MIMSIELKEKRRKNIHYISKRPWTNTICSKIGQIVQGNCMYLNCNLEAVNCNLIFLGEKIILFFCFGNVWFQIFFQKMLICSIYAITPQKLHFFADFERWMEQLWRLNRFSNKSSFPFRFYPYWQK